MNDHSPLADRLRPKTIDEVVGQAHLAGKEKPLRKILETKNLYSLILWGPPGSGKTTLARLLSQGVGADFEEYSAVNAKKSEVMAVVKAAKERLRMGQRTVLFVDEIHRFNKAQQDAFLPSVEDGSIILIGATTENPSFEVISPLLSRCRVFVLNPLTEAELRQIIQRGAQKLDLTPGSLSAEVEDYLISFANGDARQALNLLEETHRLYGQVDLEKLRQALQSKFLRYDRVGDEHYDTVSAFIKSLRASQADAALYYLARMVESGEDPIFIARRLVIFASEDIGVGQPTALVVANAVFRACETIGYPECAINLAHGVVYLCQARKDRSAYEAYGRAVEDTKKFGNLPIPLKIRNAVTKLMKDLGYGQNYEKYSGESFLPDEIKDHHYYEAKN